MKAAKKATEIKDYLEQRIAYALEWYQECDICEETLINARKDIASVLQETCQKFSLKDLPFTTKTTIEDGFIVVRTLDKKLN